MQEVARQPDGAVHDRGLQPARAAPGDAQLREIAGQLADHQDCGDAQQHHTHFEQLRSKMARDEFVDQQAGRDRDRQAQQRADDAHREHRRDVTSGGQQAEPKDITQAQGSRRKRRGEHDGAAADPRGLLEVDIGFGARRDIVEAVAAAGRQQRHRCSRLAEEPDHRSKFVAPPGAVEDHLTGRQARATDDLFHDSGLAGRAAPDLSRYVDAELARDDPARRRQRIFLRQPARDSSAAAEHPAQAGNSGVERTLGPIGRAPDALGLPCHRCVCRGSQHGQCLGVILIEERPPFVVRDDRSTSGGAQPDTLDAASDPTVVGDRNFHSWKENDTRIAEERCVACGHFEPHDAPHGPDQTPGRERGVIARQDQATALPTATGARNRVGEVLYPGIEQRAKRNRVGIVDRHEQCAIRGEGAKPACHRGFGFRPREDQIPRAGAANVMPVADLPPIRLDDREDFHLAVRDAQRTADADEVERRRVRHFAGRWRWSPPVRGKQRLQLSTSDR